MKCIIKIAIVFLVGLMSSFTYAQTYRIDDSSAAIIATLQNKPEQLNSLTSQTGSLSNTRSVTASNNIYIQQVGNNNDVVSSTHSIYSDIGLFQKGNNNEVSLGITAGVIKETLLQTGINNSIIDLNAKGAISHTTAVIQRGANQNLILLGSNSISNNMIISMQGKKQTILIRNIIN